VSHLVIKVREPGDWRVPRMLATGRRPVRGA